MSADLVNLLRRPYGNPTFAEKQEIADRIEELEAKLEKAVGLLFRAVDMTGVPHCHHDHHGYCQAHNLEPKGECWVELSQAFIAELKGGKDE